MGNKSKLDITGVVSHLFNIEYYNSKGTMLKEVEIKGRTADEAKTHFNFFYPKKHIWKITKKHIK